jgi:hypothetical protein
MFEFLILTHIIGIYKVMKRYDYLVGYRAPSHLLYRNSRSSPFPCFIDLFSMSAFSASEDYLSIRLASQELSVLTQRSSVPSALTPPK